MSIRKRGALLSTVIVALAMLVAGCGGSSAPTASKPQSHATKAASEWAEIQAKGAELQKLKTELLTWQHRGDEDIRKGKAAEAAGELTASAADMVEARQAARQLGRINAEIKAFQP
jgi:hypothetical protein